MDKKNILNIKTLRLKAGLKQHELANLIGVGQSKICEYENGNKLPSVHRLPILADALGVEINDLFLSEDSAQPEPLPVTP